MYLRATPSRLSPLSPPPGASAPPRPGPAREPADGYVGSVPAAEEAPPERPVHWKRRILAGSLIGLAVTGVAGGVAGHVLVNGPVCPGQESAISISREGVCVSPEAGSRAATAWRHIRGAAHAPQAVQDLASSQSRVLSPSGAHRPAPAPRDGTFRVVSWNLHHGQSPDSTGAREQVEEMIEHLRRQGAEVVLLQEVSPWHAQQVVDGTGMVGYYAQTTPAQGNMILVHPDLAVLDNAKQVLNADTGSVAEAAEALRDWTADSGDREPRQAQALRLALPEGRTVLVWNTHLSTGMAKPESRDAERARLLEFVEEHALPGEAVLGGGDLNGGAGSPITEALAGRGFELQGAQIDWFASRDLGTVRTGFERLQDGAGQPVSDHPLVWGDVSGV